MSVDTGAKTSRSITTQVDLLRRFQRVRALTRRIVEPLCPEDCVIQSMPDASPTRWHLAHTTWFFETFVLQPCENYRPVNDHFQYLFNSYYNAVGEQFPRAERGLLSRPTVDEVLQYRQQIDETLQSLLAAGELPDDLLAVMELGLQHEQQHQELMLTDLKHALSRNPLFPAYLDAAPTSTAGPDAQWVSFSEGVYEIGHAGHHFAFDNETPRHSVFLAEFQLASRSVTAGEYQQFIAAGGYRQPEWWLSLGWQAVTQHRWTAPLYWQQRDQDWYHFTLAGLQPVNPTAPVCHLSYFEADAFARWAGCRLPTEAEWEVAGQPLPLAGHFADTLLAAGRAVHPTSDPSSSEMSGHGLTDMFGNVWEWTASAYSPYPGYRPPAGALGEYNGKFMCNQYVLRGGSCATAAEHIRHTYRNFFPPAARWQFSGLRLAR